MHDVESRKNRLSTAVRVQQLTPWRKAVDHTDLNIYWMPQSSYPARADERLWLVRFYAQLSVHLAAQGLHADLYAQAEAFAQLQDFFTLSQRSSPMMAISKPLNGAPMLIDSEKLIAAARSGDLAANVQASPDSAYSFGNREFAALTASLASSGALTLLFRHKPESSPTQIPLPKKMLEQFPAWYSLQVQRSYVACAELSDPFPTRLKQLLLSDTDENDPLHAAPFLVPSWSANDLFSLGTSLREGCFGLFDIYIRESREDGGILFASQKNFEREISRAITDLRRDGLLYPE